MATAELQIELSGEKEDGFEMTNRRLQKGVALLILAAIVFVAARLWHLTTFGIFGDEVFTLWTSAQEWPRVFSSVVEDVVHPPLFYFLLKAWTDAGGQSLLSIKSLPALLSVITLVPFLLLCRELKISRRTTALALWLMAVNGFLITHAQESRMYSLVLLLVLISFFLFVKLQNRGHGTAGIHVALGVVNLLLVFTHYFGWVIVGLEFAFLLIWRRELMLRFAIAVVFIAICFSPWAYLVAMAARAHPNRATFFWNRPPPLSDLIGYYGNLNGPLSYRWKVFGTAAVMIVFLAPLVAQCVRMLRTRDAGREASRFWFLMLFAFVPVVLAFAASHLLPQSVWAFRYLIIAAPTYFLAIAVSVDRLKSKSIRTVLIILIAGWAGLSGFSQMRDRDLIAWEPLVNRMIQANSDDRSDLLRDSTTPFSRTPIYVTDPNVGNTIQYYLDRAGETRLLVTPVESLYSPLEKESWVALIRYRHESQPLPQELLDENGYDVEFEIEARAAGHDAFVLQVEKRLPPRSEQR